MNTWREMVQEEAERLVAGGVGHQMVVIQYQHELRVDRGQLVEQRRQHRPVQVRARAPQGLERGPAHVGLDGPERLDHVHPEAGRVVVALVQRHPGHPAGTGTGAPLGKQRRLAEPGGCVEQAELALQAGPKPALESGAR
jgi:hypothetical protein